MGGRGEGEGSCWTVIVTGCLSVGETLQGPSKVIQEILVLILVQQFSPQWIYLNQRAPLQAHYHTIINYLFCSVHYNVCVHENKCAPPWFWCVQGVCTTRGRMPLLTCPLLGLLDQDFSSFISSLLSYFQVITPTPKTELNKLLNWRGDVMKWCEFSLKF